MIIHSDDYIVIVNKKCGEAVQAAPGAENVLTENLKSRFGRLYPVHRLDVPVSGAVVLARTKKAAAALSAQFAEQDKVEKIYLCAVDNPPPSDSGRLENHLFIPSGRKNNKVFIKDEAGKDTRKAVLEYRLLYKTERYYILEIKLITGRKHQIRAQLSAAGCHVKGDIKYGARRTNRGGGIHLHSLSLSFSHPETGERVKAVAPLPDEPLWKAAARELNLPACPDQQKHKEQSNQDQDGNSPPVEPV